MLAKAYSLLGSTRKKVDLSRRRRICLPYRIKIKVLRCLKDKIEAGVYEVSCEVIDRLGGTALKYDAEKQL